MRQIISAVIDHTVKAELEIRAKQDGLPLSGYIRKVLAAHVEQPYTRQQSKEERLAKINADWGND